MYLEIVSPEAVLFSSEVDSVAVPGINGEFQMLNNHAAIVSELAAGLVKVNTHNQSHVDQGALTTKVEDDKVLILKIKSGTVEMKDNKVVILAD